MALVMVAEIVPRQGYVLAVVFYVNHPVIEILICLHGRVLLIKLAVVNPDV